MSIPENIKSVLAKVGAEYTVLNIDGTTAASGEYLDVEDNSQVTKPFIREFFLEATFPYDSSASAGDVIEIDQMSNKYLVMNMTPGPFKNQITEIQGVLYKSNVSGELLRQSGSNIGSSPTYRRNTEFDTVHETAYGVLTEVMIGTDLETNQPFAPIEVNNIELYIPHSYGVRQGDRYVPSSGEYYKVETVMPRRYDKIDVCELGEDQR